MYILDKEHKYKIKLIGYALVQKDEYNILLVYFRTHGKVITYKQKYLKNDEKYELSINENYDLEELNEANQFFLYNDKEINFNYINIDELDTSKYSTLTTLLINGVFGENTMIYESKYVIISLLQNKIVILKDGYSATKYDLICDLETSLQDRLKEMQNELI